MDDSAKSSLFARKEVSPMLELGAYEWLWLNRADSFGGIADIFRQAPESLPSELAPEDGALSTGEQAVAQLAKAGIKTFGVRVHGTGDYPERLRDAEDPVELIYYQGWWDLVDAPRRVAVVGTREISDKGIRRTKKLVKMLLQRKCTIVSGLARGVDTIAHETAIESGGGTIGVAGTPLSDCDTKPNTQLQRLIATEYLLISPVPVLPYQKQEARSSRPFYQERGRTMSALAEATIIVEAGQISGTLLQAQAALRQGRKLFILNGCFDQPNVTWPAKLEAQGAIRVREFEQIVDALRVRGAGETAANR
jgi:DNA processing protein